MKQELKNQLDLYGLKTSYIHIDELRKFKFDSGYVLNDKKELIGLAITNDKDIDKYINYSNFDKLQYLNLSDNPNLKDIKFETPVNDLVHLDLSNNALDVLQLPKNGFPKLKYFDVSNNNLETLELNGAYPRLKKLFIGNNKLKWIGLPKKLEQLEYLYLPNNKLNFIRRVVKLDENKKIDEIIFDEFSVNDKPDIIRNFKLPYLTNIKEIDLKNNQIQKVQFSNDCPKLERLDLRDNPIEDIMGLEKLFKDKEFYIYLSEDVLKKQSVFTEGKEEVWNNLNELFKRLKKEERVDLPVKVILLGNHASGKSHLVRLLKKGKYIVKSDKEKNPKNEEYIHSTHILKTYPYLINNELVANIYDFGGQDFYHGIYRMFMDSSCLYCFVWRKDKNIKEYGLEMFKNNDGSKPLEILNHPHQYWLEQINYIETSEKETKPKRTILIQSHIDIDQRKFINISDDDIERFNIIESIGLMLDPKGANLKEESSQIEEYGYLFDFFKQLLDNHIKKLRPIGFTSVKSLIKYFNDQIKNNPSKLEISIDDIKTEIKKNKVLKYYYISEVRTKHTELVRDLKVLHKTGHILYYPDKVGIMSKIWINPEGVIDKFRTLFKKDIVENGIVAYNHSLLKEIRASEMTLFQEMNLLFAHNPFEESKPKEYILPNYLPYFKSSPDFELMEFGVGEAILKIRFEYFIPFGLMSKLITYFGNNPDQKRFWRNAIIFTMKNNHNNRENVEKSISNLGKNSKNYKVSVRLDLLRNEFIFHVVHKDNKDILPNEVRKFRTYFFKVILRAYYDTGLSELNYFDEESFRIKKDDFTSENVTDNDLNRIPEDMYVSVDSTSNYLSVTELNELKIKDKFVLISSVFKDEPKGSNERIEKTTKVPGNAVLLRDFNEFSRFKLGKTLRIVISYSRDDKKELDRLVSHLQLLENSGKITLFYDRRMAPGKNFTSELKKRFNNADIIISLISPSWANSSYIMKYELPIALDRDGEEGFFHIPFLIKPTNYKEVVTFDKNGNKLIFADNNLLMDLDKARPLAASQYDYNEKDPYLKVSELISNLVKKANKN